MDQNALKMLAAKAALHYIEDGITLGVGSGSTVNCFIEALGAAKMQFADIVTASDESTRRLEALGYRVSDLNSVGRIDVYVDGCDEINPHKAMIKGGGAALTREKIVAACSAKFVCIVDESKQGPVLGRFQLRRARAGEIGRRTALARKRRHRQRQLDIRRAPPRNRRTLQAGRSD